MSVRIDRILGFGNLLHAGYRVAAEGSEINLCVANTVAVVVTAGKISVGNESQDRAIGGQRWIRAKDRVNYTQRDIDYVNRAGDLLESRSRRGYVDTKDLRISISVVRWRTRAGTWSWSSNWRQVSIRNEGDVLAIVTNRRVSIVIGNERRRRS